MNNGYLEEISDFCRRCLNILDNLFILEYLEFLFKRFYFLWFVIVE